MPIRPDLNLIRMTVYSFKIFVGQWKKCPIAQGLTIRMEIKRSMAGGAEVAVVHVGRGPESSSPPRDT